MDAVALRAELRERASREGFDRVAIARADPLGADAVALDAWLANGMHAGMRWMADTAAQRRDPAALLPGCRSVIVTAMNHGPGSDGPSDPARTGRVAGYARGRDYHRVMGRALRRLAAWIEEFTGHPARACVDTAPVLERAWAQRAGIGWIGKNACLLTRDRGSWWLLGEILTAADLPADPGPHEDSCGTCNACIEACPTGAIVAPGRVDARACISYWTIEHRGAIPIDRRAGNGAWIFGCDDCQTVCPWNRSFSAEPSGDPLSRRDDLDGLDPVAILAMDEDTFRASYSGTPLMRARWDGMRRNACVVLGNRQPPGAADALVAALDDVDPVIRSHAAWGLGRIGGPEAGNALRARLAAEPETAVRQEIEGALARDGREDLY